MVPTGKVLFLTCDTITAPQWRKKDGQIKPQILLDHNTLLVINMREEDGGLYICQGTSKDRREFNASAVVLVGGM